MAMYTGEIQTCVRIPEKWKNEDGGLHTRETDEGLYTRGVCIPDGFVYPRNGRGFVNPMGLYTREMDVGL